MPLSDSIKEQIKRRYVAMPGSQNAIANQLAPEFRTSVGTIKRLAKSGGWEVIRRGGRQIKEDVAIAIPDEVVNRAVGNVSVSSSHALDMRQILKDMIQDLSTASLGVEAKSKEGAASAMVRVMELYRTVCPQTYDDIIDTCFLIPNFNVRDFLVRLKQRLDASGG